MFTYLSLVVTEIQPEMVYAQKEIHGKDRGVIHYRYLRVYLCKPLDVDYDF